MTTLSLRHAARDEQGRLVSRRGSGYVPLPAPTGNVPARSLPSFVVDIKQEILRAVATGGVVTRADIARAVDRKKSTWLIGHIEELVERGHLCKAAGVWKNGVTMYYYEVAA